MALAVESVDDSYFSLLFHPDSESDDNIFPLSDAKYAEELQLQEALVASSSLNSAALSDLPMPIEIGESSKGYCEICVERKETDEMFRVDSCQHSFCSQCVTKHVTLKLQEKVAVVNCLSLDCDGVLELNSCREKMPDDVAARWDEMLCESLIPAEQKYYCPFNDCSALLVRDTDGEAVTQSECPYCHRLFCAKCKTAWHIGIECDEIQKLNKDERGREDLMVRELAKSNSWMRCPTCRFYVEKTEGCLHITCRCGFQFCYACGATWTKYHGGCQPA